jgi:uncharacterized membrane protein YidH (DUF202 family)
MAGRVNVSAPVLRIAVLVVGVAGLLLGAIYLAWQREEKAMNAVDVTRADVAGQVAIPPIDASAPTRTATATFALG